MHVQNGRKEAQLKRKKWSEQNLELRHIKQNIIIQTQMKKISCKTKQTYSME